MTIRNLDVAVLGASKRPGSMRTARSRGIAELWGDVLPGSAAMLGLAPSLRFEETRTTNDVVRVSLAL